MCLLCMGSLKTPRYTCPGKGQAALRPRLMGSCMSPPEFIMALLWFQTFVHELFIFYDLGLSIMWEATI